MIGHSSRILERYRTDGAGSTTNTTCMIEIRPTSKRYERLNKAEARKYLIGIRIEGTSHVARLIISMKNRKKRLFSFEFDSVRFEIEHRFRSSRERREDIFCRTSIRFYSNRYPTSVWAKTSGIKLTFTFKWKQTMISIGTREKNAIFLSNWDWKLISSKKREREKKIHSGHNST